MNCSLIVHSSCPPLTICSEENQLSFYNQSSCQQVISFNIVSMFYNLHQRRCNTQSSWLLWDERQTERERVREGATKRVREWETNKDERDQERDQERETKRA
ncbi:unnamed protein product [Gadus morhua 'NCC']